MEIAVAVFCYGHAAAAAGDDNEIIIQQGADRVLSHNVDRFGRCLLYTSMAGATLIAYIVGEGMVDASRALDEGEANHDA